MHNSIKIMQLSTQNRTRNEIELFTLTIYVSTPAKIRQQTRKPGIPISQPKSSERTNPWRRQPPVFNLFILRLQLPTTPVSSNHSCDESRQTPIRIKRTAIKPPVALAASPPQKIVGTAPCSIGSSQTCGYRSLGANP
jgi:hypothetical protein